MPLVETDEIIYSLFLPLITLDFFYIFGIRRSFNGIAVLLADLIAVCFVSMFLYELLTTFSLASV